MIHRVIQWLVAVDEERIGRALVTYGGLPLAVFMTTGLLVQIFRRFGLYSTYIDPMMNFHAYFVVNVWVVAGVYGLRQRYQQHLLLDQKHELVVAATAAFTWFLTQPLMLLGGYAYYMKAVLHKDELSPFLLDGLLPDLEPDYPEE